MVWTQGYHVVLVLHKYVSLVASRRLHWLDQEQCVTCPTSTFAVTNDSIIPNSKANGIVACSQALLVLQDSSLGSACSLFLI